MNRRKRFVLYGLLLLSMMLVSCKSEQPVIETSAIKGGTSAPMGGANEPAHDEDALRFRITWKAYSGRGEAIQRIVDEYNRQVDKKVILESGDEDIETIEAQLKGGSETVFVLPYRFVKYFGDKGLLEGLTAEFAAERVLFYDAVWALGTVDKSTYGIPWLGHSMCLLYNKRLLEKAGVKPESIRDMASFVEAVALVKEKTGAGGLGLVGKESNDVSWMVNQFIYGYGSSLVSEDGKTVTINNEKSAEALKVYRDVLGPYAQPGWEDDTAVEVMTCFRDQQVAFEILGIWGVTDIIKNGAPFETGILPLKKIGLSSEVGPMMLVLPRGMSGRGKQAALDFIRYMISKPAQEEIMKGEYSPEHDAYYPFRTPIRMDMTSSQIFRIHPEYQAFIEGFETPSVDVPVPRWQAIKDEVYAPGLHEVMRGKLSIESFLDVVEERGNEILKGR